MLFHLKEPNYEQTPGENPTRIYARAPEHILKLIDHYKTRNNSNSGNVRNGNLSWWVRQSLNSIEIEQVEQGEFIFYSNMVNSGMMFQQKSLFEILQITPDFKIFVPFENIPDFHLFRKQIPSSKRSELFKLANETLPFVNLAFVPADIAKAIMNYDLNSYFEAIKNAPKSL